ncbi:penicillin-binding protein 1C [Bacteroidota bacterium]
MIKEYLKFRYIFSSIFVILMIWFALCLPKPLFKDPTSTVLVDIENQLLAAKIATDGQWRFPQIDSIPEKFEKAVLYFEDEYFYKHPGINPISLFRAAKQNIKARKIVSGGSTITMQVIRLSRKGKPRNIYQKTIECILSLRAEIRYSKEEILALYTSNAPFGGNVVGLEAAAWRYFKQDLENLSWAEAATLAVLPNSPALIHPGRNRDELKQKRDFLLKKLKNKKVISDLDYKLALDEPLPGLPFALTQKTLHLLNRAVKDGNEGEYVQTTISSYLQNQVENIVNRHHNFLKLNEIHNAAAIVIEVETGNVLVYIGNTVDANNIHENRVDIIDAPRSTGSILKPVLYASMQMEGEILPETLVPDIPTQIAGYTPKNFDRTYDGAVYANEALSRSLNIPAVRMLQQYGVNKFHHKLRRLKFSTITKPADHYGLSIILGGAEGKLWEITGIYASMARTLNHFYNYSSKYNERDFHQPNYNLKNTVLPAKKGNDEISILDAGSIWLTFEALTNVNRPFQETGWATYVSSRNIAWKTGTSFGFRDGWAIGVTPEYAVGVWVGNATGEGRPGLTGLNTAGPLLFDIFKLLPSSNWFNAPYDELVKIPVCKKSGQRVSQNCTEIDSVFVHISGLRTEKCQYHKLINVDKNGFRVNSKCRSVYEIKQESWFVLPPVQEWYYRNKHNDYKILPPFADDCSPQENVRMMDIIYPKELSRIFIPINLDGIYSKVVFHVAHRDPESTIFWHLNDEYLGKTTQQHEMSLNPKPGKHLLTLVDEKGETLIREFEILGKN